VYIAVRDGDGGERILVPPIRRGDGYRFARESLRQALCAEDLEFIQRFESWLRTLARAGANSNWPMLVDLVVGRPASMSEFFELWDRFHDESHLEHAAPHGWAGHSGFGAG